MISIIILFFVIPIANTTITISTRYSHCRPNLYSDCNTTTHAVISITIATTKLKRTVTTSRYFKQQQCLQK